MLTHLQRAAVFSLALMVAASPLLAFAATPHDSPLVSNGSDLAVWGQCATLAAAPFACGRGGATTAPVGVLAWDTPITLSRDALPSRALGTAPRQMRASGSLLAFLRRLVI